MIKGNGQGTNWKGRRVGVDLDAMRWALVGLVVLPALFVGRLFLPPVVDHFAYAPTVPHALPSQLVYAGYVYRDPYRCGGGMCNTFATTLKRLYPQCETRGFLQQHTVAGAGTSRWPLRRLGAISTLLRAAHTTLVSHPILLPTEAYVSDGLLANPVYVEDGDCYVPYFMAG